MFRYGMNRIIANIRHSDAALPASRNINAVIPRCSNYHHSQPGQLREGFVAKLHLVDDRQGRTPQTRHDLIRGRVRVFFVSMFKARPAHSRLDRIPLQKNYMMAHSSSLIRTMESTASDRPPPAMKGNFDNVDSAGISHVTPDSFLRKTGWRKQSSHRRSIP